MKRIALVCCILLAAGVLVMAGQQYLSGKLETEATNDVLSQPVVKPIPEPAADKAEPPVEGEALEMGVGTLENSPSEREVMNPLDQGGETCALATVIPASASMSYCVTGMMGATRDCAAPPTGAKACYRDVFYSFTPLVTGRYIVGMCNSVGDVQFNISTSCCPADTFGTGDNECGGSGGDAPSDPVGYFVMTAGTTYYIQCGYAGSAQVAAAYNFSLIGPVDTNPPANDLCANATLLTMPANVSGTTHAATNDTSSSCGPTSFGYGAVFYTVVGTGNTITATVPTAGCLYFYPRLRVYRGCCNAVTCVGGAGTGGPSATYSWCSLAGETYFIVVSAYNVTPRSRGPFTLTLTDNGTPCTVTPWPSNDYCCTAIPLSIPSATQTTNVGAGSENPGTCVTSAPYSGLWYTVVGNDNLLTATTCNMYGTLTDTKIQIFRGSCGALVCVAGNDDSCPSGGVSTLRSTVSWCSDLGVTYYVHAGSYSSASQGTFELDILDGAPCHIDCNNYPPCGTPAEVEPNDACANANNFLSLTCGEGGTSAYYYGTICPQADVDYYRIPPINTLGQILIIKLYEGANCDVYPPVGLRMRGATATDGSCAAATGTATHTYVLGTNCAPFSTGGYIGVVRNTNFENKYKIEVRCSTAVLPECPNEVVANQHCAGPCVGPIPDVTTVTYPISVPIEYHITDLNVRVNITHTYDADIDMYLITPWSDTLELSTDNGAGGDNYQVTVFDDEGVNGPVTAGVAPFNGSYVPEELLAGADGFNAIGTWTLLITDDVGGDVGYVNCWCLEFNYDYILAAQLSSFDVIGRDGEVEVTWTTASETNNDRFEINRDGAKVAEVDATNNAAGSSYSWTDNGLMNGTTYTYSLVAVDMNGSRSELATESVVPSAGAAVITEYALHQNYPNPFNPTTTITFDLVEAGNVTLSVYNLMGQQVATLVHGVREAGRHTVSFDAASLPSGLYLYRIEANGFTAQHKMLLMK